MGDHNVSTDPPKGLGLIDSHCHLDYIARRGIPPTRTIEQAQQAGVSEMITIATTRESWDDVQRLASTHAQVWGVIGIHPNHVAETVASEVGAPSVETLVAACGHPRVVGVGETGLDCYRGSEHLAAQQAMMRTHINVARQTALPLVIHTRAADEPTLALLTQAYREGAFTAVIHCFSSDWSFAKAVLDMGMYLSCSAVCAYATNQDTREAIKRAPADRLLVETDAPFLPPPSRKGQANTPAYMVETFEAVMALRGHTDREAFAAQLRANTLRLFNKMDG